MTALAAVSLGLGLALVWSWVDARRFSLERRLAPRLRATRSANTPAPMLARLVAPVAGDIVRWSQRWGRPTAEVERMLARAGSASTVARHRAHGLIGGAAGLIAGLVMGGALAVARGAGPVVVIAVAAAGGAAGAIGPDLVLSRRAAARAARVRTDLPPAAEMLALAVVAGESVPAALERVAAITGGPLGEELRRVVADVRAGRPLAAALDALASHVDEPVVTAFCDAIVTALDRGTPLAEVLHAQAGDIRDRTRQALLEEGGKREIAMLVPVVLLILPVTVVFALYPGLVALRWGA